MSGAAATRGLSVLADPTRSAILQLMLRSDDGRVLVGRTALTLGLRQPTVSHHMRALLDEGIVVREQAGRHAWYGIARQHRERIGALFADEDGASVGEVDLERVIDDLAVGLAGRIRRIDVAEMVTDSHALLSASAPRRLLASCVAAFAVVRLEDAHHVAAALDERPTVLFVCVHNAGRSQLAAAMLRHLAGDRLFVRTAGSHPSEDVRASVITALDEIGVPLGGDFPKPLTPEAVDAADVLVTMGCGDVAAHRPGLLRHDWEIDDPAGRSLADVRAIRDAIDGHVRALLAELTEQ